MERSKFKYDLEHYREFITPDILDGSIRNSILKHNGTKTQCTIAMEELAELTQQISKFVRGEHNHYEFLEELADVYICLEYLETILGINSTELIHAKWVKLNQAKEKLEIEELQNRTSSSR